MSVAWLGAFVIAAAAQAQSDPYERGEGELGRWVYSGALEFGIMGYTGKGNIDGTEIVGPRVDPARPTAGDRSDLLIIDPQSSREEINSQLLGTTLEVMTPALFDGLGHPRLFMDANVSAVFTSEVGLARSADPDELKLPDSFIEGQILGESAVAGRGTKITVQPQGPQFHAGLGAAFTIDFGAERIRIKPSVVYTRMRSDVFGIARRAVRISNQTGPREYDDVFRSIAVQNKQKEVYHGVGPAIEIEYDTGNRIGPFEITLYAKAHASHLLGDLKTRFTESNPEYPEETVFFKYSQDRWVYRGSTGVRLRFLPRRDRR